MWFVFARGSRVLLVKLRDMLRVGLVSIVAAAVRGGVDHLTNEPEDRTKLQLTFWD